MAAITSLNDLIQKIYNDFDFINSKFPLLYFEIEGDISALNNSADRPCLNYYHGCLKGILRTLFIIGYISLEESKILNSELDALETSRLKHIITANVMADALLTGGQVGKIKDVLDEFIEKPKSIVEEF